MPLEIVNECSAWKRWEKLLEINELLTLRYLTFRRTMAIIICNSIALIENGRAVKLLEIEFSMSLRYRKKEMACVPVVKLRRY